MRVLGKGNVLLAASLLLVLSSGTALATPVYFFDDFEAPGYQVPYPNDSNLDWQPPVGSPWQVTAGSVDLVQSGDYNLTASTGTGLLAGGDYFLDLDGTGVGGGTLVSIALNGVNGVTVGGPGPFVNLVDGEEYLLRFIMAGNHRGYPADTAEIGVVIGGEQLTLSLASNAPWTIYQLGFTYQLGDSIYFQNMGGDNQGVLLDNVQIVPEPLSMLMLGALGSGMLAARKVRRRRA